MVRKLNHFRTNRHEFIQKRCLKNCNQKLFINDLKDAHLDFTIVDKRTPLKRTRVRKKKSPWSTKDLVNLIGNGKLLKKKAINTKDANDWNEFRKARTLLKNEIKIKESNNYKEACYNYKNNPSKLWHTLNDVCCTQKAKKQLEIEDRLVTDSSVIADAFNDHFTTIGSKLADIIGPYTA